MNGFVRLASAAAVAGGLAATGCAGGGDRLRNAYDPCWPERYSKAARDLTLAPFQAQANNGAILDHTVWNYHFEPGTDKLAPAGLEKLDYLVRRRPAPPATIFLQTTRDVGYEAATPEKYADVRRDLDQRRADAVQKYLAAQTASRPMNFEVQVIDPADPGFGAQYPVNAIRALPGQYQATIGGAAAGGPMATQSGGGGAGGMGGRR